MSGLQRPPGAGFWTKDISYKSSNYRELLAILKSILSFHHILKDKVVLILSENVTVIAYVNHLGRSSYEVTQLAKTIFMVCHKNKITISAKYLAGWEKGESRLTLQTGLYL